MMINGVSNAWIAANQRLLVTTTRRIAPELSLIEEQTDKMRALRAGN